MTALLDQARQIACHGDSAALGSSAPEILSANLPVLDDGVGFDFLWRDLAIGMHNLAHSAMEAVELGFGHLLKAIKPVLQAGPRWAHSADDGFQLVDILWCDPVKLVVPIRGKDLVFDVVQYCGDLGVVQAVALRQPDQDRNGCSEFFLHLTERCAFLRFIQGEARECGKIDAQDFSEEVIALSDHAVIVDETLDAVAAKGAKGVALMAYGLENWAVASAGYASHGDPAAAAVSLRIDIVDGGIDLVQLNDAGFVRGQHVAVVFLSRRLKRRAGDRLRCGRRRIGGIVQAIQNSSQKRHLKNSFGQRFKPLEIAKGLGIRATRKDAA